MRLQPMMPIAAVRRTTIVSVTGTKIWKTLRQRTGRAKASEEATHHALPVAYAVALMSTDSAPSGSRSRVGAPATAGGWHLVAGAAVQALWNRPRATFFDEARLAGEQGICFARLGRSAEAQAVLNSALPALDPGQEKSRHRLLIALGTAHIQQGNVEEACRLGEAALASAIRIAVHPLSARRHHFPPAARAVARHSAG